jgi:hypothetical protein
VFETATIATTTHSGVQVVSTLSERHPSANHAGADDLTYSADGERLRLSGSEIGISVSLDDTESNLREIILCSSGVGHGVHGKVGDV